MDNLISKNYQQMISVPGSQNNELNKFFETIDNLNKPFKFNESKFGLDVRDENGNSILHRIIINSLNEQELLNKIQFIPNIETLINTINFKQQTPLHLFIVSIEIKQGGKEPFLLNTSIYFFNNQVLHVYYERSFRL